MIGSALSRLLRHDFLRHVLTLMTGTALAQVLPILAAPILTRLYTPGEMGIYTAFMSLVGGVVTVAAWRYDLAVVLPKDDEDARALVKLASLLNVITCVVVTLLMFVFAGTIASWLNEPDLTPWLIGVGAVAWATAQALIFGYWCNRKTSYGVLARNRMLQSAGLNGTQLGLGALGWGATGLVAGAFVGNLLSAANLFRRTRREVAGLPSAPMASVLREHAKMPLLNAPTAILDTIRVNGVQLLIARLFTAAMLGQFGLAWQLLQAPAALINSSISQVFYQRLATMERGRLTRAVWMSMTRSALIGIVPFGLIFLLSPPLFPVIFGSPWALAGQIGAALVPWLYVNFISSPVSTVFIVTKRQGTLFWFGLPFTAIPLVLLANYHPDILSTVTALSWTMAVLLVGFLGLALWVSHGFDRGVGATPEPPHR